MLGLPNHLVFAEGLFSRVTCPVARQMVDAPRINGSWLVLLAFFVRFCRGTRRLARGFLKRRSYRPRTHRQEKAGCCCQYYTWLLHRIPMQHLVNRRGTTHSHVGCGSCR